jgi:hypothetical protein
MKGSHVLNVLKSVTERIDVNHTSGQLFEVLDTLLYRAIDPIIENSNYVDRMLSIVLAWYTQNQRRKISPLPKERFNTYVIAFLTTKDVTLRKKIYRRLGLERNITFFIVSRWLQLLRPWQDLHIRHTRGEPVLQEMASIERSVLVFNNHNLFAIIQEAKCWYEKSSDFKQRLLEKYMRFIMLEALHHYKAQQLHNPHLRLELDEVAQNFVLATYKAIDKFDANRGTLTTYIQNWLKNAKVSNHFRHEYGTAYNIPHSRKMKIASKSDTTTNNLYVELDKEEVLEVADELSVEADVVRRNEIDFIRMLAKEADPEGIGRMFLGIGEYFPTPNFVNKHEAHSTTATTASTS